MSFPRIAAWSKLCAGFIIFFCFSHTIHAATFIPRGSFWTYLDDGSDPGTAWRAPGFDDGGWSGGVAQLGYGDGDEATLVSFGSDTSNKFISTYFRHSFSVANAAQVTALTLNLLRDDGAVVYLNGTEVARPNMPGGTIRSTTLAARSIGGRDESSFTAFSVDPALLVPGGNVIAVEVHQGAANSSDISFDLELTATETATPDTVAPSTPTNLTGVAVGSGRIDLSWTASTDSGGGSVAGYNIYRDGGSTPIATVTGTAYSDTGLPSGMSFSYTVSAFDTAVPANESLQTTAVLVTPGAVDNAAPDAPTNLSATAISDTRIELSWTSSTDNGGGVVAAYNVFRDGDSTPIATVTATGYSDTGLTANTLYSYSVTAFDNAVPANESGPADVSATTFSTAVSINIIQQGGAWAFLDDGSDQGAAWRAPGFDDSGWASGSAQLGYGDRDEATSVGFGPDANNKYITTYFRRSFDIEDASRALNLTLNLLRDDGAVVYLNGTEVVRSNMPGGAIDSSTLAAVGIGGSNETTFFPFSVDPALLVTGTNVIAVEVHQHDGASSDISFDLNMSGVFAPQVGNAYLPLSENFDAGFAHEWLTIDEAGNPSNWVIAANQFQQQNLVRASMQNLIESYHLGSYAYLNEGFTLSDYRLSLDMTPLGRTGDNIGIMFRYQDENNYYRLSFDSRFGFTRLEKRVDGTFTTLARNAKGFVPGQVINVAIEVIGQAILVTVDGEPLFSVTDSDIANGTVALYCSIESAFDNLVIAPVAATPDIIISTPSADSVEVTDRLNVLAVASHIPSGGQVDFLLDGRLVSSDTTPPYTATFSAVSQGEHTVTAKLYDSDSTLIDSDTNEVVGVLGDNTVTLGDSITNGSGDSYSSDNQSADGRIRGISGYQPVLNNLLTSATLYPNIIFNEGVGGDGSFEATTRISSILERHPATDNALILLGTNDSAGTLPVSGKVFEANMKTLLAALSPGTTPTVAIPPPVFGHNSSSAPYPNPLTGSRNTFVRAYRTVITTSLAGINIGPDFFKCFLEDANYFSLFGDNLHPNGLGADVMSHLWHAILAGAMLPTDPCTIPRFVLQNLEPSTVSPYLKQNLLDIGDSVYIDEPATLATMPTGLGLESGIWVMTANADNTNAGNSYITFDVDRNVTVYLAYDIDTANPAETLPDWISDNYTDTASEITLSGVSRPLRLYSAVFSGHVSAPVSVRLGGNLASGAAGATSNYLVIVVEN